MPYNTQEVLKTVRMVKVDKVPRSKILKEDLFDKKEFMLIVKSMEINSLNGDKTSLKIGDVVLTASEKYSSDFYKAYSIRLTSLNLNYDIIHCMVGYLMAKNGYYGVRILVYIKVTQQ